MEILIIEATAYDAPASVLMVKAHTDEIIERTEARHFNVDLVVLQKGRLALGYLT